MKNLFRYFPVNAINSVVAGSSERIGERFYSNVNSRMRAGLYGLILKLNENTFFKSSREVELGSPRSR